MAQSSSSSSSSHPKYDVFLSFRGADTRCTFTSHLYAALCRKNIPTFIDDEEIKRGDELSPTLLNAIEESEISIIIFSEKYASSRWCLKELVKIIECKHTKQQILIPVFYNIDPTHVRNQTGPYEDVFIKYEMSNQCEVQEWRKALHEAANLAGWNSSRTRPDSILVENIVEDVLQKLNHIFGPQLPSGLVGIQKHIAHVESLLCIESPDVCFIGLWGMGGIGKTTIAHVLFKKLSSQFEGCCFMENVREEWENQDKFGMQKRLLVEVLGDHKLHISTSTIRSIYIKNRLQRRKVFIILDDVSDSEQIEDLVGTKNDFGSGSKIIVTTRNKEVLKKEIDGFYEVMALDDDESLQLLSLKAFELDHPKSEFIDLSKMVVNYAKGVPLVLKVLGSLLYSKSQEEWECTMKKLKKVPNTKIHRVLRLSYEALEDEEKNIFLDIACCLKGGSKYYIKCLLDGCGYSTNIGLRSLENKSLIIISKDDIVSMHDLIQEMAWQVVREESREGLEKQRYLQNPEEIYRVLKHKMDTNIAVESIMLNMSQIKDVEISPTTFSKMHNLRFLIFYLPADDKGFKKCNVHISKGLEALPYELRYLCWDCFPLKALPSSFCPEMLVILDLENSFIEKLWDGEQDLANLKSLCLRGSKHLIELPNLSRAKNLEEMDLDYCSNLRHVSIFSLDSLRELTLWHCKELQCIQSGMNSKSLEFLSLGYCSNLQQCSVTSERLKYLHLYHTAIKELPPSLGRSMNLRSLDLTGSTRLKDLPDSFFHEGLALLDRLDLSGSCIETLPESIKFVSRLRALQVANCKMLRSLPELPQSLQLLEANGCISLETVSSSAVTALIQNSFSSQDKRVLLKQIQESKITLDPSGNSECFYFSHCTRLDEDAFKTIMDEVITRIKHAAYLSSMVQPFIDPYHQFQLLCDIYGPETIENYFAQNSRSLKFNANCCSACMSSYVAFGLFESSEGEDTSHGLNGRLKICSPKEQDSPLYFNKLWHKGVRVSLPGTEIPSCFRYRTTERTSRTSRVTLQLPSPSRLLGFAFCVVLSSDLESGFRPEPHVYVDCEFVSEKTRWYMSHGGICSEKEMTLWYDAETSYRLLENIKERRSIDQCTTYNPKLSFRFSTMARIKECGVWPIYNSDLETEKDEKKKLKRKRKQESQTFPSPKKSKKSQDLETEKEKKKKKLKGKRKTSLVLWHCKWQALITRRTKKGKNHRLSKHRNRVQTTVSYTSRKTARISNTSFTE